MCAPCARPAAVLQTTAFGQPSYANCKCSSSTITEGTLPEQLLAEGTFWLKMWLDLGPGAGQERCAALQQLRCEAHAHALQQPGKHDSGRMHTFASLRPQHQPHLTPFASLGLAGPCLRPPAPPSRTPPIRGSPTRETPQTAPPTGKSRCGGSRARRPTKRAST